MQFQYNADYPGLSRLGQPTPTASNTSCTLEEISRNPQDFPPAQPIPCARITTRVYHPSRNQVSTVQNVLVRTMNVPPSNNAGGINGILFSMGGTNNTSNGSNNNKADDNSFSSGMSSSSSDDDDDDSMNVDDSSSQSQQYPITDNSNGGPDEIQNAYWIQRTIREAIYGRVLFAVVLKRRPRSLAIADGAEWEVTSDHCAVKEMSWQHIRKERDRLAEDPIKEVSSMQYIQHWYRLQSQQNIIQQQQEQYTNPILINNESDNNNPNNTKNNNSNVANVAESFRAMRETNIMMPLDLLSDERNLYSIMPYCDGGELFERLDVNERFSEEEARYWMDQVLNGIENLQHVGVCHRDMSLENLLVHKDGALIIDMGMCLLIPYDDSTQSNIILSSQNSNNNTNSLTASFNNMNMNGGAINNHPIVSPQQQKQTIQFAVNGLPQPQQQTLISCRQKSRYLIRPQGTCGKWIYMSPEIYLNQGPFDGYAVDMWAAGVILFLMLTGFPPWERACQTDERFHYMTAGYLVQMLTEWEIGLSSDAMDLLQRMLFLDPKDRLSLDQVRAHPWMVNGRRAPPASLNNR